MRLTCSELKKKGILLFTETCNIKVLDVSFKVSIIVLCLFKNKSNKNVQCNEKCAK